MVNIPYKGKGTAELFTPPLTLEKYPFYYIQAMMFDIHIAYLTALVD